jgi:hypothetical protein
MKVGVGLTVSAGDLNPLQVEQKDQYTALRFHEGGGSILKRSEIALRGSSEDR